MAYNNSDVSRREVRVKYALKNYNKAYAEWNYDTNGSENLCHKSL
jgi:hypothetical protein